MDHDHDHDVDESERGRRSSNSSRPLTAAQFMMYVREILAMSNSSGSAAICHSPNSKS